jgi:hypothetical protein
LPICALADGFMRHPLVKRGNFGTSP